MINKRYVKSRNVTKIVFEHPAGVQADAIELFADLHGWTPLAFDRLRSGKWKLVLELEPGSAMQFRYRVHRGGGVDYWNDADADGAVPNGHGSDNAVVAA